MPFWTRPWDWSWWNWDRAKIPFPHLHVETVCQPTDNKVRGWVRSEEGNKSKDNKNLKMKIKINFILERWKANQNPVKAQSHKNWNPVLWGTIRGLANNKKRFMSQYRLPWKQWGGGDGPWVCRYVRGVSVIPGQEETGGVGCVYGWHKTLVGWEELAGLEVTRGRKVGG